MPFAIFHHRSGRFPSISDTPTDHRRNQKNIDRNGLKVIACITDSYYIISCFGVFNSLTIQICSKQLFVIYHSKTPLISFILIYTDMKYISYIPLEFNTNFISVINHQEVFFFAGLGVLRSIYFLYIRSNALLPLGTIEYVSDLLRCIMVQREALFSYSA